jgi:hypothetical protein
VDQIEMIDEKKEALNRTMIRELRPEQQILKFLAHWTSEPVTIRQGRMPDQYQVSIAGRPGLVRVSPDGEVQWIYGEM